MAAPAPAMGGAGGFGGAAGPPQAIQGQVIRADLAVSGWSNRWLAYSRYDGLFVTREDLEELERGTAEGKAVLLAIWQYVETGGTLVVLGPGKVNVPAAWARHSTTVEGLTKYRPGFGLCLVTPDRKSEDWPQERWQEISASVSQTGQPWRSSRGLIDLNLGFPVVDDLGVPVRGLFALLILFGVAIGPVNLALLSRKNKRIWLLWTVPVLSAFFCLVVMGYMLAAEGWQGHARVGGFTLLDEGARRATTLGKTAFYSPMTPGDGLRFSEETEVQIQGNEHPAYASPCAIDWTGEQHLARGWVTARVPAHFTLRKSEPRRERLNLRREADGTLTVINALGGDISKLWLADEKGELYTAAAAVPAGDKAKLEKAGRPPRRGWPAEAWRRDYTGSDWAVAIEEAVKKPGELLGPGTYLAVVEESPFLEQALKGAKVRPSKSVVLGIMAGK
jgi:hypothetical protein